MAGIKVYSTPTVQAAPRTARELSFNPQDPTRGFTGALSETAQFIQEEQQKANMTRVRGDLNALQQEKIRLLGEASQAQGEAAVKPDAQGRTLADRILAGLDSKAQALRGGLANADQQERFEAQARSLRLELEGQVRRHVAGQAEGLARANFAGGLTIQEKEAEAGIRGGDFERAGRALARARQIAGEEAERRGYSGETAAAHAMEALTPLHATTLKALVEGGQVELAGKYLERNASEMTPQVVEAMRRKIQDGLEANQIQSAADEISGAGLSLAEQDKKARELFKDKPEQLKALRIELRDRDNLNKVSQERTRQEAKGKVLDMWRPSVPGQERVSIGNIKRSQEWASLSAEDRQELLDYWDRQARGDGYGVNPGDPVAAHATFLRFVDNPRQLIAMTDQQIASYQPLLGEKLTMQLMDAKRKAAGNLDELAKVTLSDANFDKIAEEYGLRKTNTSKENLESLNNVRSRAMEIVRSEAQDTGRPVDQARKEQIIRNLFTQVKVRGQWSSEPVYKVKEWNQIESTPGERFAFLNWVDEVNANRGASGLQPISKKPEVFAEFLEIYRQNGGK